MAKRSRRDEDVVEEKVFAAVAEIDDAIAKQRRRFDEVRALDGRTFAYDDPRVASAERNISDTVLSIYGPKSPEYRRFSSYQIWYGPMALNMSKAELHRGFALGLPHAREDLENLIRGLEEKKADLAGDTTARVRSAFEGLDLHPRIAAVSTDLYRDGHYRNAVLDASVALVNLVREKSRRHDLDGSGLMSTVFSKNNPILAFKRTAGQDRRRRAGRDDAPADGGGDGGEEPTRPCTDRRLARDGAGVPRPR